MRNFKSCVIQQCYLCDPIKEDMVGRPCNTRGENDKIHAQFWSQNLKKINNLENLNVPWEVNILIDLQEI